MPIVPMLAVLGIVFLVTLFLLDRRVQQQEAAKRKRIPSWRQHEHYRHFYSALSPDSRHVFDSLDEQAQFQSYLDWSLREGLTKSIE